MQMELIRPGKYKINVITAVVKNIMSKKWGLLGTRGRTSRIKRPNTLSAIASK